VTNKDVTATEGASSVQAALPERLVAGARQFIAAARAERTRTAYAKSWAAFVGWCEAHGRTALPASADTIAAWMTDLAQAGRAASTINAMVAAVAVAHRTAGHPLDRKSPLIADVWKGIANETARAPRQARPMLAGELKALLEDLRYRAPSDARDAALLALGWAAALRRSELVGLDWQATGTGSGSLSIDERGLVVTLNRSKASQSEAVTVVVPCADMPAACEAVRAWVDLAKLEPGTPVFRPVDKGQRISADRLTDRSVARIIKARIWARAVAAGKSEAEADALVESFSGHSLRAGYATAAASADVPAYRIQQHTRHKTAEMVTRYIREADKWTKSGLKGVGF
jgi:integrase